MERSRVQSSLAAPSSRCGLNEVCTSRPTACAFQLRPAVCLPSWRRRLRRRGARRDRCRANRLYRPLVIATTRHALLALHAACKWHAPRPTWAAPTRAVPTGPTTPVDRTPSHLTQLESPEAQHRCRPAACDADACDSSGLPVTKQTFVRVPCDPRRGRREAQLSSIKRSPGHARLEGRARRGGHGP